MLVKYVNIRRNFKRFLKVFLKIVFFLVRVFFFLGSVCDKVVVVINFFCRLLF